MNQPLHLALKKRQTRIPPPHARQSGVALIISLILLVLMTLVGLAGIRMISKEERMVGQVYDRSLALQAAESALREAEIKIEDAGRPAPAVNTACALSGAPAQVKVCGDLVAASVPRWISTSFTDWTPASPVGSSTLIITPEYFVEYLGGNFSCSLLNVAASTCKRYRVSVRAKAGSDRASVVLQSIYATYDP
jgi:type IV pilus assembly protein PilX